MPVLVDIAILYINGKIIGLKKDGSFHCFPKWYAYNIWKDKKQIRIRRATLFAATIRFAFNVIRILFNANSFNRSMLNYKAETMTPF